MELIIQEIIQKVISHCEKAEISHLISSANFFEYGINVFSLCYNFGI